MENSAYQIRLGGVFGEDGKADVPSYFERKTDKAERAIEKGCAVVDLSYYGRVSFAGEGCRSFLHGQSTQSFTDLPAGSGVETVFTDPQGHVLDLARCLALASSVMVILSPGAKEGVLARLERHVFPADRVRLVDVSARTAMFAVMGPESAELMRELNAQALVDQPAHSHIVLDYAGKPCIIAAGCGIPNVRGFTFIADETVSGELYRSIITKGAKPIGTRDYERARVRAGRPSFGKELTPGHTALEARLFHAISLNKGCYVGQEALAKVHNLKAVRRQLWGLAVTGPVSEGDEIASFEDGEVLGSVTSRMTLEVDGAKRSYALGYLRCRPKGAAAPVDLRGLEVRVGRHVGVVIEVPALLNEFPEGAAPPPSSRGGVGQGGEVGSAEAEAKAQKMAAMQAQVATFMAQQAQAKARGPGSGSEPSSSS